MLEYRPWDDKELMESSAYMSNREMSRRFGGDERSYRRARKKFGLGPAREYNIPPKSPADMEFDAKVQKAASRLVADLTTEEKVERDKEVIRLQSDLREVRALYRASLKEHTLHEVVAEEMARNIQPLCVSYEPPRRVKVDKRTMESAVLTFADWHGDEMVSEEIMEGLNAYDPYIMGRRAQTCADSTLSLMFDHHSGTVFDEIVVLDVGDGITGALHEENKYMNSLPPFAAMTMVAEVKARVLMDLAAHVPSLRYYGVPGNHWRYTKTVNWKMPTETSDWLIYHMMALRLKEHPNIEVVYPKAWSHVVDIKGHGFSLNHGYSDAKGGFGGISWYTQQRADSKRTAIDQRLGRRVDYRVYGHIHNEAVIGRMGKGQIITVPSLKGGDEYAKEGLAGAYSDAGQMLWGVHAERGKTWAYSPLAVTENDDSDDCRYDSVIEQALSLKQ